MYELQYSSIHMQWFNVIKAEPNIYIWIPPEPHCHLNLYLIIYSRVNDMHRSQTVYHDWIAKILMRFVFVWNNEILQLGITVIIHKCKTTKMEIICAIEYSNTIILYLFWVNLAIISTRIAWIAIKFANNKLLFGENSKLLNCCICNWRKNKSFPILVSDENH